MEKGIKDTYEKVRDKTTETIEKTKDAIEKTVDFTKDTYGIVKDKTKETYSLVKDRTKEFLGIENKPEDAIDIESTSEDDNQLSMDIEIPIAESEDQKAEEEIV